MSRGGIRTGGSRAKTPRTPPAAPGGRVRAFPPGYIERTPLLERLDEVLAYRLTTVVAGPGFGKSTLVRAWASRVNCAWYALAPGDRAIDTFARGLTSAVRDRVPAFPADVLEAVESAAGGERRGFARVDAAGAFLCEGLERSLTADLVLVLDDIHELERGSDAARLVETICRQAPAALHLVLVGRTEPPFSTQRLRGRGEILEVGAEGLGFSDDEVSGLLARLVGPEAVELATPLYELSAGWPAAVRLAVEALRFESPEQWTQILDRVRAPTGPLFAYLSDEVLAREPPQARELIRRIAPLERVTPELCQALGTPDAQELLSSLARRGIFVEQHEATTAWFSLHALVRNFAAHRLPLDELELRELHARAARWFEERGLFGEALESLVHTGDHQSIAKLLVTHEEQLLTGGLVGRVIQAGERLPQALRDRTVEQLLGEAYFVADDLPSALASLERAAAGVDRIPPDLALSLGSVHYNLGDLGAAAATHARAHLEAEDTVDETLLLAAWSNVCSLRGETKPARKHADGAMNAAERAGSQRALAHARHALGLVATAEGDGRQAIGHYRAELEAAERCAETLQLIRGHNNLAVMLTAEGENEEALEAVEVAIRLAELHAFRAEAYHVLPYALDTRARARFNSGRLDEARVDYEAALAVFRRRRSHFASVCLLGLGDLHRARGQLALARTMYEEGLALGEASQMAPVRRHALAGLLRLSSDEDPDETSRLADRAMALGPGEKSAGVLIAVGWLALAQDDRARARTLAEDVLATAIGRDAADVPEALELRAFAVGERQDARATIEQARGLWQALGNPIGEARAEYALARLASPTDERAAARAKRKLRSLGVGESAAGATGVLMALGPERPPPLQVQMLGAFRVLRDGVPVPAGDWQSKKARDLLKLLVTRQGRAVPRDVLIEALWPAEDPRKTHNRLSVALSVLRTVLDPQHEHPPEHYLRSSADAVALEHGRIVVDADGFRAEAEAGLAAAHEGRRRPALELLEAAEASYAGDFLEEDLYEDWATAPREDLRSTYVAVARALAQRADEPRMAARYLRRILERDPYDEQTHLDLVSALAAGRAQGEARRAYRAYVARMEEIGVEPAVFPSPPSPRGAGAKDIRRTP